MKLYPDQPETLKDNPDYARSTIMEILAEELPDCVTNDWFLESTYCANMIDKIVRQLQND